MKIQDMPEHIHALEIKIEWLEAALREAEEECATRETITHGLHSKLTAFGERIAQLEIKIAHKHRLFIEATGDGDRQAERIAQLEAALNQIVMAASYRCEESVETLEAALAFIKMTAREALASKEQK